MQRKSFGNMHCPIARSLERVGEWWSILILRDAFYGLTRFDEFQKSLGVAPNMLTRRLNALVEAGLLERRRYSEHPPRDEYVLTERGRDFRPVLLALLAWGNRHFAPEGAAVQLVDTRTGAPVEPVLVDRATGEQIAGPGFAMVPGPGADDGVRRRLAERGHRPFAAWSGSMSTETLDRGAAREVRPTAAAASPRSPRIRFNRRLALAASRPDRRRRDRLVRLELVEGRPLYRDHRRRLCRRQRDHLVAACRRASSRKILVGDNQFVKAGQLADRARRPRLQGRSRPCRGGGRSSSRRRSPICTRNTTLQQSMIGQAEADLAAKQAEAGYARGRTPPATTRWR